VPTVLDHPLAAHYLTILRDRTTSSPDFRLATRRLAHLLVAEATSDMRLEDVAIETPLEGTTGKRLAKPVALVSVLRAGLGLIDAALELFPTARIGYAGVQRHEDTAQPVEYYTKFPRLDDARVLILEPMLATGGSLEWATSTVVANGATDVTAVCVVAAPEGIERMSRAHPGVRLVIAAIDRGLDESSYIRPGLGDMGDRLFGTE
jgi:uracil phosphoribosyltransferase